MYRVKGIHIAELVRVMILCILRAEVKVAFFFWRRTNRRFTLRNLLAYIVKGPFHIKEKIYWIILSDAYGNLEDMEDQFILTSPVQRNPRGKKYTAGESESLSVKLPPCKERKKPKRT